MVACTECARGHFWFQKDANASKAYTTASCAGMCPNGKFASDPGWPMCETCSKGKVSVKAGTHCDACVVGKYAKLLFKGELTRRCTSCPTGQFNAAAASTKCTACAIGHFNPDTGIAKCTPCPKGKFQDSTAATACVLCPTGRYEKYHDAHGIVRSKAVKIDSNCKSSHPPTPVPTLLVVPTPAAVPTPVPTPVVCHALTVSGVPKGSPGSECMGTYIWQQMVNSRPVFQIVAQGGQGQDCYGGSGVLFYFSGYKMWMVGESLDADTKYSIIAHSQAAAPELVPTGAWYNSVDRQKLAKMTVTCQGMTAAPTPAPTRPPTPVPSPAPPTPPPPTPHRNAQPEPTKAPTGVPTAAPTAYPTPPKPRNPEDQPRDEVGTGTAVLYGGR
jgi:hypothetical protein